MYKMNAEETQEQIKAFSKIFDNLCKVSKVARKYKSRINKHLKSGEFVEAYAIYLHMEAEVEDED